jgi:cytoplasmic iron level regulating protein YaaA (DUF328/UPF0246 family)
MAKIILIACCKTKLYKDAPAYKLYCSDLFKKSYQYAVKLNPDKIYILSAMYGLIPASMLIAPYNLTLNKMSHQKIKNWSNEVIGRLDLLCNLQSDTFICLAGENYLKFLRPKINHVEEPLKGMGIGKRLQWLKNI